MVEEGVLFECLQNPIVSEVLIISRRHYDCQHPKLKELIVPDFFQMEKYAVKIKGYDAIFFCAGGSSVGMKEDKYSHLTYDTTLAFAKVLSAVNSNMIFTYVSGSHTDSSEKGRQMWARVIGRRENDLAKLPLKGEYNFRQGAMFSFKGQKNWKTVYKLIVQIIRIFSPKTVLTMQEVGRAMINAATSAIPKTSWK